MPKLSLDNSTTKLGNFATFLINRFTTLHQTTHCKATVTLKYQNKL